MFRPGLVAVILLGPALAAAEWADPTRPPAGYEVAGETGQGGPELPKLSAIRIGRGSRVAVIDGIAVTVGAMAAGYRVLTIEPGRVTVSRNGAELELLLWRHVKKTSTKGH